MWGQHFHIIQRSQCIREEKSLVSKLHQSGDPRAEALGALIFRRGGFLSGLVEIEPTLEKSQSGSWGSGL